jgi:hypothetical protein
MGLVIIGAAIACIIGWHVSKAHMSHRGIPVRKRQLRDFRKERMRHGVWLVGLAVVLLLIVIGAGAILH